MHLQQIFCQICTKPVLTQFSSTEQTEVCGRVCANELAWRRKLASENLPYTPVPKPRVIRIAELDPVPELDSFVEDLIGVPDLRIDRYLIPKHAYEVFAAHPPPIGLDFPIATLELEGEQQDRAYGFSAVKTLLQDLSISAFAATRKMKKKKLK